MLKTSLDRLYASFDHPESAVDPIQIVRRYAAVADREIVAFVAAGLAFGRVASVMASVEAVCRVLGPEPAAFVRAFEPARDGAPLLPLVHRWIRGRDLVALLWVLRQLITRYGSLENAVAAGLPRAIPMSVRRSNGWPPKCAPSTWRRLTAPRCRRSRASTISFRGPRQAARASA